MPDDCCSIFNTAYKNKITRMKKLLIVFFFAFFAVAVFAQQNSYQCYPANWWAGMKLNKLQLMIHGDAIAKGDFIIAYPGITLIKVNKVENPNYVFLDIGISAVAKPGIAKIKVKGVVPAEIDFEIKTKRA